MLQPRTVAEGAGGSAFNERISEIRRITYLADGKVWEYMMYVFGQWTGV